MKDIPLAVLFSVNYSLSFKTEMNTLVLEIIKLEDSSLYIRNITKVVRFQVVIFRSKMPVAGKQLPGRICAIFSSFQLYLPCCFCLS